MQSDAATWLSRAALWWVRFAMTAWSGAATLFVINAVRQVTSGQFADVVLDQMIVIRFNGYYAFGFTLVGSALLALPLSRPLRTFGTKRGVAIITLAVIALAGMIVDDQWVYSPLVELITPPGQPRTAGFDRLHRLSEIINSVHVGAAMLAAGLLCCRPANGVS